MTARPGGDPRGRLSRLARPRLLRPTLAALLAGLRPPQEGDLRVSGRVVVAPQFHENHVFVASLAFNLLLGRRWPARPGDLELAATVCRELGLRPLLDRMPAGLEQIVGETGWHLSQGERSLVFIARALLAEPQLVILDESLGPLDPATHPRALDRVLAQNAAVLVITH